MTSVPPDRSPPSKCRASSSGHAERDEPAEQPSGGGADPGAGERGGEHPADDHGSDPGDQQRAEQAEEPAQQSAAHRALGRAFGGLAARAFEQVALLDPLLHRHADAILREPRGLEVADRGLRARPMAEEADDGAPGGLLRSVSGMPSIWLMIVLLAVGREAGEPTYDAIRDGGDDPHRAATATVDMPAELEARSTDRQALW